MSQISTDWEVNNEVITWKLKDVPELGYLSTDRPFPRGELLVKTRSFIKGYFKNPEVSSLVILCLLCFKP